MRLTIGNRRTVVAALAGLVVGGAIAALAFVAAMYLFGTNAICAGGIVCELAGYRNIGAARGIHLVGSVDPFTQIAVAWESADRQLQPTVQYRVVGGATGGDDWSTATGHSRRAAGNGVVASSAWINRVRVDGLEPGRRYQYRVSWDGRARKREYSPIHVARTPARDQPIRLAFVSDTCLDDRPDGLSGPLEKIRQYLRGDDIDLILGGGDYACSVDDGRYTIPEAVVQRFFDEWQDIFSATPFIGQFGNHECCHGENPALWSDRLALSWAPMQSADGRSFAFDLPTARIVGLYATGATEQTPADHVAWLDETLTQARAADIPHVVVFQHAPLFGQGRTHPPEPALRRQLIPVLERGRVDLHISAHDMSYERTAPLTDAAEGEPMIGSLDDAGWPGVVYAKVSATGRTTSNPDNVPAELPRHIVVADDQHFFYAILEIPPTATAPMQYTAYAIDREGRRSVLDRFEMAP